MADTALAELEGERALSEKVMHGVVVGSELVSVGFLIWALWQQMDKAQAEAAVRRWKARLATLVAPCTACAERKKMARRMLWEAMEIVRGAAADDRHQH